VVIESKEEMRKRGVDSPDRAEALMLASADRTPEIVRYYKEQAERLEAAAAPMVANPAVPIIEDEGDLDHLSRVYERELERLEGRKWK
jgi:hypothetical protein